MGKLDELTTLRRGSVLTVEGYDARLTVERGHLVVRDGWPAQGNVREIHFPRGRCDVERIVVRAFGGQLTIAAVDWCHQMNIPIAIVGSDSRLLNTLIPPGRSDAPLKRAQAMAGLCDDALPIARDMLRTKFLAQLRAIQRDFCLFGISDAANSEHKRIIGEIQETIKNLAFANTLRELLTREGYVARLYWSLLNGASLPWPDWTHDRIPLHWRRISPRETGRTQQVREATDPFNAMLNYAYTLLEVELRIAVASNGLDPDLGLIHVDTRARESLVHDLMDSARPSVDLMCLEFARKPGLRPHMFHELRDGVVRLDPDTAKALAADLMPKLRRPASEAVVAFAASLRKIDVPYRLTIRGMQIRAIPESEQPKFGSCARCGVPLTRLGRRFCSRQCTLQHNLETNPPLAIAHAKLRQMKEEGHDPRANLGANKERGAKIAESNRRRAKNKTADDKRRAVNAKSARYRERKRAEKPVD